MRGGGLPVASFLGITLIGMSVGQRVLMIDGDEAGEVQLLAVHAQTAPKRVRCA